MPNAKSLCAAVLLAIGAALLGYAIFFTHAKADAPEWEPANKRLEQALAVFPSDQLTASPQPHDIRSSTPPVNPPPTQPDTQPPVNPLPAQTSQTPSPTNNLLDLNTATQSQLDDLPGIGPSKAKAIIAYREQKGVFKSVKQLLEVKGIGPKMLEKLTPYITVETLNKG